MDETFSRVASDGPNRVPSAAMSTEYFGGVPIARVPSAQEERGEALQQLLQKRSEVKALRTGSAASSIAGSAGGSRMNLLGYDESSKLLIDRVRSESSAGGNSEEVGDDGMKPMRLLDVKRLEALMIAEGRVKKRVDVFDNVDELTYVPCEILEITLADKGTFAKIAQNNDARKQVFEHFSYQLALVTMAPQHLMVVHSAVMQPPPAERGGLKLRHPEMEKKRKEELLKGGCRMGCFWKTLVRPPLRCLLEFLSWLGGERC